MNTNEEIVNFIYAELGVPCTLEELKKITPSNEELLKLAEKFPAPQEWYDEVYDLPKE